MKKYLFAIAFLVLPIYVRVAAPAHVNGGPAQVPEQHVLQPTPEGVKPNTTGNVQAQTTGVESSDSSQTSEKEHPSFFESLTGNGLAQDMGGFSTPQTIVGSVFITLLALFLIFCGVYILRKKYGKKQ